MESIPNDFDDDSTDTEITPDSSSESENESETPERIVAIREPIPADVDTHASDGLRLNCHEIQDILNYLQHNVEQKNDDYVVDSTIYEDQNHERIENQRFYTCPQFDQFMKCYQSTHNQYVFFLYPCTSFFIFFRYYL